MYFDPLHPHYTCPSNTYLLMCVNYSGWVANSFAGVWSRQRGYKTFFMLNSTEHELCSANKYQITDYFKFLLVKDSWAWYFFCANKYENANSHRHFHIYQQRKCYAQLSMKRRFITSGPGLHGLDQSHLSEYLEYIVCRWFDLELHQI